MRARVPLDVDLQDRLVYGLSPARFACLVTGGVVGMACWSALPAPALMRLPAALVALGVGALFAWARWGGRTLDAWICDIAAFYVRNRRFRWDASRLRTLTFGNGRERARVTGLGKPKSGLRRRMHKLPQRLAPRLAWFVLAIHWLIEP